MDNDNTADLATHIISSPIIVCLQSGSTLKLFLCLGQCRVLPQNQETLLFTVCSDKSEVTIKEQIRHLV